MYPKIRTAIGEMRKMQLNLSGAEWNSTPANAMKSQMSLVFCNCLALFIRRQPEAIEEVL